jgi:hypothetical protein
MLKNMQKEMLKKTAEQVNVQKHANEKAEKELLSRGMLKNMLR